MSPRPSGAGLFPLSFFRKPHCGLIAEEMFDATDSLREVSTEIRIEHYDHVTFLTERGHRPPVSAALFADIREMHEGHCLFTLWPSAEHSTCTV